MFLDEFQDTTYAQYDFLLTAFQSSGAVLTAVGDDKQRIMVWAGARPDAFARFQTDFGAARVRLVFNYRSSPGLVRVQQIVARALDSKCPRVVSKADAKIEGDVAEIWSFTTEAKEARAIAQWICDDMAMRSLGQRDYAVLVRQTADRFEDQLAAPFAEVGLRLRNESRTVGRTSLQDLLAEDITSIVLAVLRLAVQKKAPVAWTLASNAVGDLRAADPMDAVARQQIETDLKSAIANLRAYFSDVGPSVTAAQEAVSRVISFLDMGALARTYPEYGRGESLEIAAEAITLYMSECADNANSWTQVLDEFEGVDQVPLMTVHKSKGLEYDTMLFVGLDDKMWWSHKTGDYEGLATFFVAFSRAKQRAIFTYCSTRGTRIEVKDLYDLLSAAGVPERTP